MPTITPNLWFDGDAEQAARDLALVDGQQRHAAFERQRKLAGESQR